MMKEITLIFVSLLVSASEGTILTNCSQFYPFVQLAQVAVPLLYLPSSGFFDPNPFVPILHPSIDNSDWMKNKFIDNTTKVNRIAIPGTHDSGATLTDLATLRYQCQVWDFATQLKVGIRYFDLRVENNGSLRIFHGPVPQPTTLPQVLNTIIGFLNAHRSEFVVIRIRQEDTQGDAEGFKNQVFALMNGNDIFVRNLPSSNVPPTYGDVKGKIVVMTDFQDPSTIYFDKSNPNIILEDDYDIYFQLPTCCNKISIMQQYQAWADYSGNQSRWSIQHASGSGANLNLSIACSPRDVAYLTNNDLDNWISAELPTRHFWGILIIDFPGLELINLIISYPLAAP